MLIFTVHHNNLRGGQDGLHGGYGADPARVIVSWHVPTPVDEMPLGTLTRESIERAIAEFDDLGRDAFLSKYGFGRATSYALVVNGREYDPKAIAGVAYGLDHPAEGPLKNTDFSGGVQLRSAYRPAGFDVVLRTRADSFDLRDLLEQFMSDYLAAKTQPYSGSHAIHGIVRQLTEALATSSPLIARPDVKVKASVGLGNWAGVPWIAFLDARSTTSTQRGVYPVVLFREDMKGVYLTVAQGVTDLRQQGRRHMLERLAEAAERVRGCATSDLWSRGFVDGNDIGLGSSPLARDYTASTIVHKFYEAGNVPDDSTILQDLDAALDLVDADLQVTSSAGGPDLEIVATAFREAVDASGLRVPTGHGDRVLALLAALVTKPFVILSGMSGSGKTQLALRLGEWFGTGPRGRRFLPVPVRPDWTGPEALFGYEDALRPAVAGKAAWFVPSTLEFLLAAAAEPDMPYLLLLDEMNLAHVERYFSDFLSGVESRDAVLPNLSRGPDGEWRLLSDSESLVPLPRNVFVVGTVNVDETTYQFSPKVLDRATTFEVRTQTDELIDEVGKPAAIPPAESQFLKVLTDRVLDDSWQDGDEVLAPIGASLRDLHDRLSATGDEFGHRVYYESRRFAVALNELGVDGRDALLDHIVMLKVLPRIHGSRRRAEPVLNTLLAFALDPDAARDRPVEAETVGRLPMSVHKIRRMLRTLEMNQFVSFTD